jgi:hypothetical protein
MNKEAAEIGVLTAIVERLSGHRLPKLLAMKEKVDKGNPLNDKELDFLKKTVSDSGQVMNMIDKHPQYQELATKVMTLYKEIIDKALEVEKSV